MLMYKSYKLFIRNYSACMLWKFSRNIWVNNSNYIFVEINNKIYQKKANKLEPVKGIEVAIVFRD
jgi:hypothetical protein